MPPEVSVVIPSHNRRAALARGLQALAAQTLEPDRFEVVVYLDGCIDGSAEMLARIDVPFPLRMLEGPGRGPASARNAGAAAARGRLLVFLDDDIEADPGLLTAHLEAHADGAQVVIGYSKPRLPDERGLFAQALRGWWEDVFQRMAASGRRFTYQDLLSGNVSIDRRLFEAVGGFDESFGCREDYELGWRLMAAGARFAYAPDALGLHHDASTLARSFGRQRQEGAADVAFVRRHPLALSSLPLSSPPRGFAARAARRLAFRAPALGDAAAGFAARLLGPVERLHARGRWWRLYDWLRTYWYMRGVASALASPEEYGELLNGPRAVVAPAPASLGIDTAVAPFVAGLAEAPGVEPPAKRHVAPSLAATLDEWLIPASAERAVPPPPAPVPLRAPCAHAQPDGPVALGEVDLENWVFRPPLKPTARPRRLLVRRGRSALGWVSVAPADGPVADEAARVRDAVVTQLAREHVRRIAGRALGPEPAPEPVPISIVICTRDRTDNLRRCLEAVAELDYPAFEVVVVDNAPRTESTRELVAASPGVRYVREPRPGLDWARNRGVQSAAHGIVAFTDDDTRVDRWWLWGFAAAFADPGVDAATGLVAPMFLDTPAQRYFEDVYGGMGKGFQPRWFRRAQIGDRDLLWASRCGVGANMAFRREVFEALGGFDPALDVGTATRGGGDIEYFHRVLAAGRTLAYEPSAIVWHQHRETWDQLRAQLADNGCAFAAYLSTCAERRTAPAPVVARFAAGAWAGRWLLARLLRPGAHRRGLVMAEISGALQGRTALRRARAQAARLAEAQA